MASPASRRTEPRTAFAPETVRHAWGSGVGQSSVAVSPRPLLETHSGNTSRGDESWRPPERSLTPIRAGYRSFEPALRAFVEAFTEPVLQVPFLPDIMTRSA